MSDTSQWAQENGRLWAKRNGLWEPVDAVYGKKYGRWQSGEALWARYGERFVPPDTPPPPPSNWEGSGIASPVQAVAATHLSGTMPNPAGTIDPILWAENQWCNLDGSGYPACRDDALYAAKYPIQAKHDTPLKDVPAEYNWAEGAVIPENAQKDRDGSGWYACNAWMHVYLNANNAGQRLGVRVEIRRWYILQKLADGTWHRTYQYGPLGGAYYDGSVRNGVGMTSSQRGVRTVNGEDVLWCTLDPLFTLGKDTFHGWSGNWPRTAFVTFDAPMFQIQWYAEMRLADVNGNPIYDAGNKFVGVMGGDWFRSTGQTNVEGPGIGIPRYKIITGDWQAFTASNLSYANMKIYRVPWSRVLP